MSEGSRDRDEEALGKELETAAQDYAALLGTLRKALNESEALKENLRGAQERGTELLMEARALRKRVRVLETALLWCGINEKDVEDLGEKEVKEWRRVVVILLSEPSRT